jgi:glutamate synthase domain-containing protein 2
VIHALRRLILPGLVTLTALLLVTGLFWPTALWGFALLGPVLAVAAHDLLQRRHSVLRNFPVLGHFRFLLEDLGPELHQYLVEDNTDGRPYDRDERTLAYQRAKNQSSLKPFGTELDVYREGYSWIAHSIAPVAVCENPVGELRVMVGATQCAQPYSASVLNISAMSFGALGSQAVRALNRGALAGRFAHNTGEGGLSRYHREPGGDIIWQLGTGYFGCRNSAGGFDAGHFEKSAALNQVKMIEIKLSQGAKPGHGGVLPGVKVTREIAEARGVAAGETCYSPTFHSAFSTPLELLQFAARLRDWSGGKPVGIKLCVGSPIELFSIFKAIEESGLHPDFITVDGAEGGTGAAPLEFSDHVGMPLIEGLVLVNNGLSRIGARQQVRVAASGKRLSAFDMAVVMALGADWCNQARGFMLSLGCIQSQRCHLNDCPVGVATQDPSLQRALVVEDKAKRVEHFHARTLEALAEILAAAGLSHPSDLEPSHLWQRTGPHSVESFASLYQVAGEQHLASFSDPGIESAWQHARADRFH